MSLRWFVCPVDSDAGGRWPRVARIVDPSRPATPGLDAQGQPTMLAKFYRSMAAISDGKAGQANANCLCVVRSTDWAALLAAANVIDLLETVFEEAGDNTLRSTPRGLGWSQAKMIRVRDRLVNNGVDVTGITADTPLWKILLRIGQRFCPGWDPRLVWGR